MEEEEDGAKPEDPSFRVAGQKIYLYCPKVYGRTKLSNVAFERYRLRVLRCGSAGCRPEIS
jgi:hypothetical protein